MKTLPYTIIITFLLCLSYNQLANAQNDSSIEEAAQSVVVSSKNYASMEWMGCPPPLDNEGCFISVLQGDPSKPNSDVMFKLTAGASVPEHWHSSAERMLLVSGELHVTYKGEDTKILKGGDYAYGPSNKPHKAKCADGEDCLLFIAFVEPVDSYVKP